MTTTGTATPMAILVPVARPEGLAEFSVGDVAIAGAVALVDVVGEVVDAAVDDDAEPVPVVDGADVVGALDGLEVEEPDGAACALVVVKICRPLVTESGEVGNVTSRGSRRGGEPALLSATCEMSSTTRTSRVTDVLRRTSKKPLYASHVMLGLVGSNVPNPQQKKRP
jgi:hypothetical protein